MEVAASNCRVGDWFSVRCSGSNHYYEHYNDVIMSLVASQITVASIVYSTICSDADQRKHQRSASLAFVRGIHRWPVNSPHKGPVTRKMLPFDDVIIISTPCIPFLSAAASIFSILQSTEIMFRILEGTWYHAFASYQVHILNAYIVPGNDISYTKYIVVSVSIDIFLTWTFEDQPTTIQFASSITMTS